MPFAVPCKQNFVSEFKRLKGNQEFNITPDKPAPLDPPGLLKNEPDPISYYHKDRAKKLGESIVWNRDLVEVFNAFKMVKERGGVPDSANPEARYDARNRLYKERRIKDTLRALKEAYGDDSDQYLEGEIFGKATKLEQGRKYFNDNGRNPQTLKEMSAAYTAYQKGNEESEQLVNLEDIDHRHDVSNAMYWWDMNNVYNKSKESLRHVNITTNEKSDASTNTAIKASDDGTKEIPPCANALNVGRWPCLGENTVGLGWNGDKTLRFDVTELYYLLSLPRNMRETKGDSNLPIDVYEYYLIMAFNAQDTILRTNSIVKDTSLNNQ